MEFGIGHSSPPRPVRNLVLVHRLGWKQNASIKKIGARFVPIHPPKVWTKYVSKRNRDKIFHIHFAYPAIQSFYFFATHHLPVGVMWSLDLMSTRQMAQTRARQVCITRFKLARSGPNSLRPDVERPGGAQHRGCRLFPPIFLQVLVKTNAPALIWRPIRRYLRLRRCTTSELEENSISELFSSYNSEQRV
jgi:hypothetical protein